MQRAQVLVVDDDDTIRDLLRTVCTIAGFEVETASDGAEALRILLRAEEPWIVLLDVLMPNQTGLEVCSRLMAAGGLAARHIVLLMTAGNFPDGDPPPPAWAMIRKPFDLSVLLDLLDQMERAAQQHPGATDDAPEAACTSDFPSGERAA